MIQERRKYIRLDAELDFTYKIKDAKDPVEKGVTKDISPSGIQALVAKRIKKGDWLELNISVPTLKKPLFSVGKVIWTAGEKSGKINVGIKFEEVDPEMKNKFLEYICELMFSKLEDLRRGYGFI